MHQQGHKTALINGHFWVWQKLVDSFEMKKNNLHSTKEQRHDSQVTNKSSCTDCRCRPALSWPVYTNKSICTDCHYRPALSWPVYRGWHCDRRHSASDAHVSVTVVNGPCLAGCWMTTSGRECRRTLPWSHRSLCCSSDVLDRPRSAAGLDRSVRRCLPALRTTAAVCFLASPWHNNRLSHRLMRLRNNKSTELPQSTEQAKICRVQHEWQHV